MTGLAARPVREPDQRANESAVQATAGTLHRPVVHQPDLAAREGPWTGRTAAFVRRLVHRADQVRLDKVPAP